MTQIPSATNANPKLSKSKIRTGASEKNGIIRIRNTHASASTATKRNATTLFQDISWFAALVNARK